MGQPRRAEEGETAGETVSPTLDAGELLECRPENLASCFLGHFSRPKCLTR